MACCALYVYYGNRYRIRIYFNKPFIVKLSRNNIITSVIPPCLYNTYLYTTTTHMIYKVYLRIIEKLHARATPTHYTILFIFHTYSKTNDDKHFWNT